MSSAPSIIGILVGFPVAFIFIIACVRAADTGSAPSSQPSYNLPASRPVIQRQRAIPLDSVEAKRIRREQRIRWAKDDLESVRGEKGRLVARDAQGDASIVVDERRHIKRLQKARPHNVSTNESGLDRSHVPKDVFLKLPLELRIQIYSQLNYGTVLRLAATCRVLYADDPSRYIDPEQRATFVYHAETFPKNMKAWRLACYSCLRVRPSKCFGELDIEYVAFGSKELERTCRACRIEQGKAGWGTVMMWKVRKFFGLGGQ